MSRLPDPIDETSASDPSTSGSTTAADGTPHPVDLTPDRRSRVAWVVLLAGPVIWFAHFMVVYLVVEAGCSGGGAGLRLLDPPVPTLVTLGATAAAAAGSLGFARWTYRRWRPAGTNSNQDPFEDATPESEERIADEAVAFGGFLLCLLSFVTILFVGLPALFLPAC